MLETVLHMTPELLKGFLDYIPLVILVSVSIAVYKWHTVKFQSPEILIFLGFAVFFEILSRILYNKSVNNLPYLHLYTLLEFIIISLFFLRTANSKLFRNIIKFFIPTFSIFAIINAFFLQGIMNYNSYSRTIECILIIFFCLYFYFQMLDQLKIKEPKQSPDFWFNTAFLLYFAGSFVLFILSNVLSHQSKDINLVAWAMHSFLLGILHIQISIGLWKIPKI